MGAVIPPDDGARAFLPRKCVIDLRKTIAVGQWTAAPFHRSHDRSMLSLVSLSMNRFVYIGLVRNMGLPISGLDIPTLPRVDIPLHEPPG